MLQIWRSWVYISKLYYTNLRQIIYSFKSRQKNQFDRNKIQLSVSHDQFCERILSFAEYPESSKRLDVSFVNWNILIIWKRSFNKELFLYPWKCSYVQNYKITNSGICQKAFNCRGLVNSSIFVCMFFAISIMKKMSHMKCCQLFFDHFYLSCVKHI